MGFICESQLSDYWSNKTFSSEGFFNLNESKVFVI